MLLRWVEDWIQRLYVYVKALEVNEELATWPEQENREGRWVSSTTVCFSLYVIYDYTKKTDRSLYYCINAQLIIKEALELCRYEWMQSAFEEFLRVITEDGMTKEEILAVSSISKRGDQIDSLGTAL